MRFLTLSSGSSKSLPTHELRFRMILRLLCTKAVTVVSIFKHSFAFRQGQIGEAAKHAGALK